MKVSKSSADTMFPFNTPTGSMSCGAVEPGSASSHSQESFNDFECVPESKVHDASVASATHYF